MVDSEVRSCLQALEVASDDACLGEARKMFSPRHRKGTEYCILARQYTTIQCKDPKDSFELRPIRRISVNTIAGQNFSRNSPPKK